MRALLIVGTLAACASHDATPAGGSSIVPPPGPPLTTPRLADRRCLPVVSRECGCVYTCGAGVRAGDHWDVTHAFWKGISLKAKVEPWCIAGACTDAFAAELPCDIICAPKPADATCHFDGAGVCVGAP